MVASWVFAIGFLLECCEATNSSLAIRSPASPHSHNNSHVLNRGACSLASRADTPISLFLFLLVYRAQDPSLYPDARRLGRALAKIGSEAGLRDELKSALQLWSSVPE